MKPLVTGVPHLPQQTDVSEWRRTQNANCLTNVLPFNHSYCLQLLPATMCLQYVNRWKNALLLADQYSVEPHSQATPCTLEWDSRLYTVTPCITRSQAWYIIKG